MNTTLESQVLEITGGSNFRELGGYKTLSGKVVKKHKLIRAGGLNNLSDMDLEYLKNYGVKKVVDFRSSEEVIQWPDRLPDGVEYYFNPVFKKEITRSAHEITNWDLQTKNNANFGYQHMIHLYEDLVDSEISQKAYRNSFKELLKNDKTESCLLFHCSSGKDRTGFGAFLILMALGVPYLTVRRDYLKTNTILQRYIDDLIKRAEDEGKDLATIKSIFDVQSVNAEYIDHAVKLIDYKYGGIYKYLREVMNLSLSDLQNLQDIYLE